ncbi:hypothetical protein GMORB2_5472 [Geosmithia morbida]|uniref:Uncharacterized protein n=1 Tax=Geosmithia morbida TaxID=1094350 RepID=A0A9P4YMM3_9HYPO|nr:uncharacterized protein GMORB2_5472 [Geosmithia morbida]KAF4119247.1 hypothetical protein GMORB2_5472 [Geosmithia morbida]
MGNNLSSTFEPDLSGVVLDPGDKRDDIIMTVAFFGSLYVVGIIWGTCSLIDRWSGVLTLGKRKQTSFGSVLAAAFLSLAWPVVAAYLLYSPE